MVDWQSLATYNTIGIQLFNGTLRRMSAERTEIELLNTLDPLALTAIHNRYYPEVYRFARFRLSDAATAEDVAGEVFVRLLEAVHQGCGPHTNLRGWLLRTTANIVNDHFRKFYNQPKEDPAELLETSGDLPPSQSDPADLTDQAEQNRLLRAAVNELTKAQKLVITLRFGNKFSLEETAQLMGKNANTIKALQFRALQTLRHKLGKGV